MRSGLDSNLLDRLWATYKSQPTAELRDRLFHYYFGQVKYHARRIYSKLPMEQVDLDDLIAEGSIGLLNAIGRYQPERGIAFVTFCELHIRGAILDSLRAMDWVPRLTRRRARQAGAAISLLQNQLGRQPTDDELFQEMKLPTAEFKRVVEGSVPVRVCSLSRKIGGGSRDSGERVSDTKESEGVNLIPDRGSVDPARQAERDELKAFITKDLNRTERLIIILLYFEGLSMTEIGAVIGISESRISQIHSNIILRFRARLGAGE